MLRENDFGQTSKIMDDGNILEQTAAADPDSSGDSLGYASRHAAGVDSTLE